MAPQPTHPVAIFAIAQRRFIRPHFRPRREQQTHAGNDISGDGVTVLVRQIFVLGGDLELTSKFLINYSCLWLAGHACLALAPLRDRPEARD